MNTNSTIFPGITGALGGGMILEAFSGLPFLFCVAMVIGAVALAFGAVVVVASLIAPRRVPVSVRRRIPARATA
jgi:hypothetical protein